MLLRDPRRRSHVLFATFAFNIALWSALSFVAKRFDSQFFDWVSLVVAVSLPATAQRFFQAFLGDEAGPPPLSKLTVVGAGVFYMALLISKFVEPVHTTVWFRGAFLAYVFVGLYLSVFYLYARYRATPSRVEKTRLLYLVIGGIATVTSALMEALPHGPNFGNVFIIVYMYFLSQNLVRYRLLDLNELLGRMLVLGTLVFILALIYGVLVRWVGPDEQGLFFFNTLLASAAIVILIEPMRVRIEAGISRWMFQEKFELVAAHRDAARRAGQRHRHARAGAARAGGAGGFAAHHPRLGLPRRSRRVGLRAGGMRRPAPRRALRRHRAPRVLRADPPHGRHHASRGSSASWRRAARCRTRSRRACSSCCGRSTR